MAYVAAVMANPEFTARFSDDLVQPGLRIPITADAQLFTEAIALGNEVIWLHCYGERFTDQPANRPKKVPRLPKESAPTIPAGGTIPSAPEPLPDAMSYDPAARRLNVGKGYVENVTPAMWAYEISGKQVLWQWFSYRRGNRTKPQIGDKRPPSPLDAIKPEGWLPEYTTDLLDLLHILGRLIALEPEQAALLNASVKVQYKVQRNSVPRARLQHPIRPRQNRRAKARANWRSVGCGDKSAKISRNKAGSRIIQMIRQL